MNRALTLRKILMGFPLVFPILHFSMVNSFSFTSAKEFLSHSAGAGRCITQECHPQFIKGKKAFQHAPVSTGDCGACHTANAYPDKYGLDINQVTACFRCHKGMEQKIQTSMFIHSPIKNGNCTSCHDPHISDTPFFLKESYSQLCISCHNPRGLFSGKNIHKPAADGNCGLCHDPHASNYQSRLTDIGANLCLTCHDAMVSGMTKEYVHAPLIKTGCTSCHDPHSGEDSMRLKVSKEEICFTCHEEKKNEVSHYTHKHKPVHEGKCTECHSPHYSDVKYLLSDEVDTLCYNCHKDKSIWKTRRFRHGPIVEGNCTACHNPHGSDNAYILRLAFPYEFYSAYEKGTYNLCFLCHKEAMVLVDKTETITSFRNGERNLHELHVNQQKGRTCRACHDVHASDLDHHLREEFKFGSSNIPMYYFKTSTGGRCIPGCHKERGYDRMKNVAN